ncbi:MAG TPA: S53 family peptidase [Mycobacteriales bacterium]|nr:S53 family peptidase [Mycobacteriales bacterium]
MTRPRPVIVGLAAAAVLLSGTTAVAVDTASAHPLQALTWNVLPGLAKLTATGHPQPSRRMHIGVLLHNPNDAALQQLADAVNDPHSPQYRHFRTPAQLTREFGLPAATGDRLRSWLAAGGLHIGYAAPSNDYVEAVGTAAQVERLFRVTLSTYRSQGVSFVANQGAPRVPADLDVASLMGLNTLQHFATPKPLTVKHEAPAATGCFEGITALCEEGYDARDMWRLYGMPKGNLGQDQTMAVFGEGQTAPVIGDLRRFEHYNHLPRVPVKVIHVGKGPFANNDGQFEWDLDTQSATGMAPLVKQLRLYFASDLSDAGVTAAFARWINDPHGPKQANASFGECESDPLNPILGSPAANPPLPIQQGLGDNLEPAIESTLMPKILAEGRTLFNSSGDTGSSCPVVVLPGVGAGNGLLNQVVPLQQYPAVSKYVTSVGGTLLYSDGKTPPNRRLELASPFGGGGSSLFNSEPPWQQAQSHVLVPCLVDYRGKPYALGTRCRGVPDVSALFGDAVALGFDIFGNGRLLTTGGTSLASPLWMGMWTRVQAAAHNQRKGAGSAAPVLYRIGDGPHYARDFNDVTVGTNGAYLALPGWDYVTGFGSPKLANLMTDIDGRTKPVHHAHPKPAPLPRAVSCRAVFHSAAGNAIDETLAGIGNTAPQPELDIVKGRLSIVRHGHARYLRTVMTIHDLSNKLPLDALQPTTVLPGGVDWVFDVVVKGTTYFADAHHETGSPVTYSAGKVSNKTGGAVVKPGEHVTGSFHPGKDGTIVMDLPLAAIGNPKAGSRIQQPMAFTNLNSVLPFLASPDAAGPHFDYRLRHC